MDSGKKSDSRSSRWPLVAITAIFLLAVAAVATAACLGVIPLYGLGPDLTLESLLVLTGFLLMFILLSSLPLLMILGYRQTQQKTLLRRVAQDLLLCGLRDTHLQVRVAEFKARNSYRAFVLPALVNLGFLVGMWAVTLMPGGLTGLSESLSRWVEIGAGY